MVTKIKFNGFLGATLNYNEKKVQQEKAELLEAKNYLKDETQLSFQDKLERMKQLNELRPDVTVNTLHAKIAFHPTDKLSDEQLKEIAGEYMRRLGYEEQPYLVYKHHDTAVPHLHVVSTLVQPNGERIPTHNVGKDKSEIIRKELEEQYGLEKAENHKLEEAYQMKPVNVQKVAYGEKTSKESMQQVIKSAMEDYKMASLEEYNALLRTYNVVADKGSEQSRIREYGGLQYKILDENGQTVGTPIKASSFYFKPTLKNLDEKFKIDKEARKAAFPELKGKIDWVLSQNPTDVNGFINELKKDNIEVLARMNEQKQIYGLTFIDRDQKIVVNGSTLGKNYSSNAILKKFELAHRTTPEYDIDQVVKQAGELNKGNLPNIANKREMELITPEVMQQNAKLPYSSEQDAGKMLGYGPNPGTSTSSSASPENPIKLPEIKPPVKVKAQSASKAPSGGDFTLPAKLSAKTYHGLTSILAYTEGNDQTPFELKKDKRKKKRLNH